MAEAVKVIVRCRPMNAREKGLNCQDVVNIDGRTALCSITNPGDKKAPPKSFTFDGAYDVNSTTEQIYADIGFPLVEGVSEGYNGTIFAYGQTGCGKSFSMQGISDPPTQRGIIPRAFDHIFETIQCSEGIKFLVHASYLEIYNEETRDLLGKDIKQKLELKEHPDKGIYVQSLSMHPCKNVTDCERVMEKGWKNRSTGSTLMNADSSRSHSIFTIHLERCDTDDCGEEHIKAAKLNLVDLAGSERQAKTGASGDRLKEATKINLSLSALGNVISALVDGKSKHIPYRDSKLTRLLQDSLGGNTKTLMVACLSPADNNYDETLSTLRYANRAKNIKNKPKINEDPKDAMLREYQGEIERLKAMLRGDIPVQLDGSSGGGGSKPRVIEKVVTVSNREEIEAEKQRIREEYEQEMKTMKAELMTMKAGKEEVEREMNKLREQRDHQLAVIDESSEPVDDSVEEDIGEIEEDEIVQRSEPKHAIHLATHKGKTSGKASSENSVQDAEKRLQELQQNFVGGEQANNEEVKERRKKKKRYAEERRKKLQETLSKVEGDDMIVEIYEGVQDELRYKNKQLEKEKQKCDSLQREILDLQSEFEFDRIDYLDTIRKQEQQMKYLQAVVDRIHPTLRRDCNYVNLDRIRAQSEWDEMNQTWVLPKMVCERSHLPPAGGGGAVAAAQNGGVSYTNGYTNGDAFDDMRSEERYIQKLHHSETQQLAKNYFKSTRAEELLNMTPASGMTGSNDGGLSVRHTTSYNKMPSASPVTSEPDESYIRKPTRLESLSIPSAKQKKKKSNGNGGSQW